MKILIIGLGSIAQKHINSIIRLSEDVEFFALRRVDSKVNYQGINNIYELDGKFDFAIVSNPTSEHAVTISQLIQLKIPLFIEKPLFENSKYDLLIDKINQNGIPTYVACNLRFLECINFVKDLINQKRINEVNIYCGSYLPDWRPNVDFRSVYSANKDLGGGVHIDLIHEIDYLTYLFGFPLKIQKTFTNKSSLNITAYDYANYLLEYKEFCASVILNYYRKTPKRILEIICEDGEFVVDLLKNSVQWNGEYVFCSDQRISDTYLPQMKYFLNNVIMGSFKHKINDVNEAYKILKLCLED